MGLVAHIIIYMLPNTKAPTNFSFGMVAFAFIAFGFGLGSYYSIIYPMVGLAVKKEHTGTFTSMQALRTPSSASCKLSA